MDLIQDIKNLDEEYTLRNNHFESLCKLIMRAKSEDDRNQVNNLTTLTVDVSDGELTIEYVDRVIRARHLFFADSEGEITSYILCHRDSVPPGGDSVEIEKIEFDEQGETDIAPKEDDQKYRLDNLADAVSIVTNWAVRSLR